MSKNEFWDLGKRSRMEKVTEVRIVLMLGNRRKSGPRTKK